MKSIKSTILVFLVFIFAFVSAVAQNQNRRTFIVLQDNSGSYYRDSYKGDIFVLQKKLQNLFLNEEISSDYNLLKKEREQGILFFDERKDNIFFNWFVADQKGNVHFYNTNGDYKKFTSYFFVDGKYPNFVKSDLSVKDFFRFNFSNRPSLTNCPNNFHLGTYSFTAFAYPLCLDKIINSNYSDEYVIIIISDFKAGSTFGNKQDEKIFRDAFKKKANCVIDRVNWLNAQFFKIEYFDYYQKVADYYNNSGIIGFTAFKLKPNIGKTIPENIDLRLDSNIEFEQKSFGKENFIMEESAVVFNHNNNLKVDKVLLKFDIDGKSKPLVKDITPFMEYDGANGIYRFKKIPDLKLSGFGVEPSKLNGSLTYIFNSTYKLDSEKSAIKYSFDVQRSIDKSNFHFQTKLSNMEVFALVTILVLLILAIVIIVLLYKGRPIGILTKFARFNDSYESVDFSSEGAGKIHTDYKSWTSVDESNEGFSIKVKGRLNYLDFNKFFNWQENTGYKIRIYPVKLQCPSGFSAYIAGGNGKISNDPTIPIELTDAFEDSCFNFSLVIRRQNNTVKIVEPLPFSLGVEIYCSNNGIRKFSLSTKLSYDFHVGPQLGNIWIGLDPGTTGSCIATATDAGDLTIEKDAKGVDLISPSVLLINSTGMKNGDKEDIRSKVHFGKTADAVKTEKGNIHKFVSIKKLLGYNTSFDLGISKEGKPLTVSSSFLSTLMIEGLLNQHSEYIQNNQKDFPQFFVDGKYLPQRAVIAIPNNFTASKIQQLKECVMDIKDSPIKELRFIYEAEAILVNYINSSKSDLEKQKSVSGENIFIYDMGGATINATLANVKCRKRDGNIVWDIEILSKLGYGVGGDTIDYAYLQWIFSKKDNFHDLAIHNPFGVSSTMTMAERRKLKEEVLNLKKKTINNFEKHSDTLIDRYSLKGFNGWSLDVLEDDNDPFNSDIKNDKHSFLYSKIFRTFIYKNVASIVADVMSICKEKSIITLDTVLMSGRSSHFPLVKEKVEEGIKNAGYSSKVILLNLEESKSAVAKGACYYGTQNNRIILHNMVTNGVFGVIQKLAPNSRPIFHSLIQDGLCFNEDGYVQGTASITDGQDFVFNGKRVKFCQVMGVNPEEIIANEEKHKYTEIAVIPAEPLPVQKVQMTITNKDKILCSVTDTSGDELPQVEALVRDSDIMACNDEQYTFFVKQS